MDFFYLATPYKPKIYEEAFVAMDGTSVYDYFWSK
ncbi:hypothetical protein EV197_3019 [Aquimarina brevivitae]|uniref:Uncharacterized protein n=1 Tax=Aquimarina brevivitae TaxID=323412 RepID=A0A4Q7NXB7_9FLAO|nr:hypothetical protein EV197_3019 [Aquimarina brevivitae]